MSDPACESPRYAPLIRSPYASQIRTLAALLHTAHQSVPCHFCDNARCCDGHALCVPFYNRHLRNCNLRYCHGVIQQDIRLHSQFRHSCAHSLVSRLEDIDLIDPGRTRHPHANGKGLIYDLIIELLTLRRGQFLGIIEIKDLTVCRKDDCTGDYRPRQRAASRLINTADEFTVFVSILILSHFDKPFTLIM